MIFHSSSHLPSHASVPATPVRTTRVIPTTLATRTPLHARRFFVTQTKNSPAVSTITLAPAMTWHQDDSDTDSDSSKDSDLSPDNNTEPAAGSVVTITGSTNGRLTSMSRVTTAATPRMRTTMSTTPVTTTRTGHAFTTVGETTVTLSHRPPARRTLGTESTLCIDWTMLRYEPWDDCIIRNAHLSLNVHAHAGLSL